MRQTGAELNARDTRRCRPATTRGAAVADAGRAAAAGTGSLAEAYADYNLADTRYELGQCTDVMSLLDHSQAIQGRRTEIDALRHDAQRTCG